jgi:hypothetical protein
MSRHEEGLGGLRVLAVGRFQVMALLQAARAFTLGLPLESAHSWGLNRAIFIAAAKRGFKGRARGEGGQAGGRKTSKGGAVYRLGDDMAFKTQRKGVLLFTIGGEVQTEEDFERQVKARFGDTFEAAWREALGYVGSFDKKTLLSSDEFFGEVYRPMRDELADKWTAASVSSG